jgi:hypothetical protein
MIRGINVRYHKDLLIIGFDFIWFSFLVILRKKIAINGVPHWSLFLKQSAESKVDAMHCACK